MSKIKILSNYICYAQQKDGKRNFLEGEKEERRRRKRETKERSGNQLKKRAKTKRIRLCSLTLFYIHDCPT